MTTTKMPGSAWGDHDLEAEVRMITPEDAKALIDRAGNEKRNRPKRLAHVAKFIGIIERGEWVLNGEPIILDKEGHLLDGQHRLSAIIETGKGVPMLVVLNGVPWKDVMKTVDAGRNRSIADVLSLSGFSNTNALAGAIKWCYPPLMRGHSPTHQSLVSLTADQALGFLRGKGRELPTWVTRILPHADALKTINISPSMICGLSFLFRQADSVMADKFIDLVAIGPGTGQKDHPIHLLRNRLMAQSRSSKLTRSCTSAFLVIAWNHLVEGIRGPMIYRWREGEDFPQIKGLKPWVDDE